MMVAACYWDIESNNFLWYRMHAHDHHSIFAIDISFDGNFIVSGGGGSMVRCILLTQDKKFINLGACIYRQID